MVEPRNCYHYWMDQPEPDKYHDPTKNFCGSVFASAFYEYRFSLSHSLPVVVFLYVISTNWTDSTKDLLLMLAVAVITSSNFSLFLNLFEICLETLERQ